MAETTEINSHFRSWENSKKIIKDNFTTALWNSNHTEFYRAFAIIYQWNACNLFKDVSWRRSLLANLIFVPTFNMFSLHENMNCEKLLPKLDDLPTDNEKSKEELKKLEEVISDYLLFYTNFIQEINQNPRILNGLTYNKCFNTQGTTSFLIDFSKKTQQNKALYEDFPRNKMFTDNETKRIITVRQLVAFYDHSWLDSNESPDETTCKFWIAIDSLLTEEQSDKLSHIINFDSNESNTSGINLREQFCSQDFRNKVINYWESTFLEKNFVKKTEEKDNDGNIIESYEIDLENLPDKNRFQKIMYLPDRDLTSEEISFKNAFLQKADESPNKAKEIVNSLCMPSDKPKIPKELQNMMEVIDSANFNYKIEDATFYDDFLNQFFEKVISRDQILQDILNGNYNDVPPIVFEDIIKVFLKDYDEEKRKDIISKLLSSESKLRDDYGERLLKLQSIHEKGSGFLKSCFKDSNIVSKFIGSEEFSQALYFKLDLYPQDKRLKILKLLLSEKSKLPNNIKQKLAIEYFELIPGSIKKLARDELTLNKKTLFKFYKKLFSICKNDPKKIFNLLQKIYNDDKTNSKFKKIIYQNASRVLSLFTENENNRQKIFQDMINTIDLKYSTTNDVDYSNEIKPLKKNFDKLVFKSKKGENLIPPLIADEHKSI